MINDPWPTPFASSGFDLDAVGVINQSPQMNANWIDKQNIYFQSETRVLHFPKVSNTDIRSNKIEKSVKKAMIYWIIENNYLDQLIKFYELNKRIPQIYLPTNEMLIWIQNLPNNFNDIFSNY
jgi:hypothetical protein